MPLCQSRSNPGRLSSPSREELSSIWKEDCSRKGESTSLGSDSTIRITSTTTFWLDLITKLGFADDPRLEPALKILKDKRRADGTWLLDRVHPDLGPGASIHLVVKKVKPLALEVPGKPSKWITLTALRVLKRVEDAS